jgi:hypothetical protein
MIRKKIKNNKRGTKQEQQMTNNMGVDLLAEAPTRGQCSLGIDSHVQAWFWCSNSLGGRRSKPLNFFFGFCLPTPNSQAELGNRLPSG